jgi:hypothetical protein
MIAGAAFIVFLPLLKIVSISDERMRQFQAFRAGVAIGAATFLAPLQAIRDGRRDVANLIYAEPPRP